MTDANLVLGYLNPEYFYGGELRLDVDAVHRAIDEQIRRPLDLATVEEAAHGIFRTVNANMANAIRRVSAMRGIDPREMPLLAFGGNGPVHAGMQAAELDIREVVIPKTAPTFSALGLLLTDPTVVELRSYITPIDDADTARIAALYDQMREAALASLAVGGFRGRDIELNRIAYLCYPGQTFDMPVAWNGDGTVSRRALERVTEAFHRRHEELHTYASRDQRPILRALGLEATARTDKPDLPRVPSSSRDATVARKGRRRAYFADRWIDTPVYDGRKLRARQTIRGPAIVEEPLTTIVVYPDQHVRLDAHGNYRLLLG